MILSGLIQILKLMYDYGQSVKSVLFFTSTIPSKSNSKFKCQSLFLYTLFMGDHFTNNQGIMSEVQRYKFQIRKKKNTFTCPYHIMLNSKTIALFSSSYLMERNSFHSAIFNWKS